MIDIIEIGEDITFYDTQTTRAANILSVQLGALEYAPTIGIDLRYFLADEVQFQNDSFKSYLVQVLANQGINVASMVEVVEDLASRYTINLTPEQTSGGMIAR